MHQLDPPDKIDHYGGRASEGIENAQALRDAIREKIVGGEPPRVSTAAAPQHGLLR